MDLYRNLHLICFLCFVKNTLKISSIKFSIFCCFSYSVHVTIAVCEKNHANSANFARIPAFLKEAILCCCFSCFSRSGLLLNGQVTLELILIGAAVSGAVWLFCYRTLGYRPQRERVLLRRLPRYAHYAAALAAEIFKANLTVMRAILSGRPCPPAIRRVHRRCGRRARACCLRTPSRSRPVP